MEVSTIKQIAQSVKKGRLEKGLTQQELAEQTGLSLRSIQRIENAEVLPRSYSLKALSKELEFELPKAGFIKHDSLHISKPNLGINQSQKIIISLSIAVVLFLLGAAFIFQSVTFPESTFEFFLFLAAMITVYAITLIFVWRDKRVSK